MKVVINDCFGGFNLSDAAVEYCLARGMTCTTYDPQGNYVNPNATFVKSGKSLLGNYYYAKDEYEKEFRCHPIIVEAVETLGEKANGSCSKLKVIEIPFKTTDGWMIDEYDGVEQIEEEHRTWS